jgi:hypothetical protein
MKKIYLLLLLLLTSLSFAQTPVITAIVDGTCNGGTPKMIEIYAQGTVDFSQYTIEKQSNGGSFSSSFDLTPLGTVTDDYVYLYNDGSNSGAFANNFPSAAGKTQLANSFFSGNGDDAFRIVDNSSNVIDIFGVENEDGSGKPWEYKDSYAKRNSGTTPSAIFNTNDWTFGGPDFLDNKCGSFESEMGGIQTYYQSSTPSGPYLNEDFESGTFPPANWENAQIGDPAGWQETTSYANSPTHSAFHNDDNVSNTCNDWLISPAIDLSSSNTPVFSYYEYVKYPSWADMHEVVISTDYNGSGDPSTATWTVLNDAIGDSNWTKKEFDLSAYKTANVHIAFHYSGDYASEWYIDDVVIDEAPACPPPTDFSVTAQSSDTIDVSWNPGGSSTDWIIVWGPQGFTPDFAATSNIANVSGVTSYQITGLNPETDYDIYIVTDCGSGDLSDSVGPLSTFTSVINNNCANAINLQVYGVNQSAGHELATGINNYVSDSGMHPSCDNSGTNLDLFYTFTIPPGENKIKIITGGDVGDKIEAAVYDACGGIELACEGRSNEKIITGLTGGQQYILQIWVDDISSNIGNFTIALELLPQPPANDVCSGAANLAVYPTESSAGNETYGNTELATDSGNAPSCATSPIFDYFYQFTLPANVTDINILTGEATGEDLNIAIYDNCGGNEIICEEGNTNHIIRGLTGGNTYILQVWHEGSDVGLFNIAVEVAPQPPVNDECDNAINIPVDESGNGCNNPVLGNNEYATDSGIAIPSCSSSYAYGSGGDVWFSVNVPASGNLSVETMSANSDITDTVMAIYSGDCAGLTEIDCNDDGGPGLFSKIELNGLNPGDVLYVRVYEYGNNAFGNFGICAYDHSVAALSENIIEGLQYYPNPVNNSLYIKAKSNIENISLFDISGKEVLNMIPNHPEIQVDMSRLQKGVYFVKISIDGSLSSFKIVKE